MITKQEDIEEKEDEQELGNWTESTPITEHQKLTRKAKPTDFASLNCSTMVLDARTVLL